jgi:hypothetical protein
MRKAKFLWLKVFGESFFFFLDARRKDATLDILPAASCT